MLVLLGVLVFVYNFVEGIFSLNGVEPSLTVEFLYNAAFLCGIVWWLQAEVKKSAVQNLYCSGVIVGAGWMIIIPYHLLQTRGTKGFIPLLALVGSFVVARILAGVVFLIWQLTQGTLVITIFTDSFGRSNLI